jgi:hypothetical protein
MQASRPLRQLAESWKTGYRQQYVQLSCTGGQDGPHDWPNPHRKVTFFLKDFDFARLGTKTRHRIFQSRTTPSETCDFGLAALLPSERIQVQEYGGAPKPAYMFRAGTAGPLREAFRLMGLPGRGSGGARPAAAAAQKLARTCSVDQRALVLQWLQAGACR